MKRSKKFKALQEKWYSQLKKSGFDDIEQYAKETEFFDERPRLINWHSQRFKKTYDPEIERYYQLAGQFIYSHKFKTQRDQKIWTLHAEGHSMSEIASHMSMFKSTVGYIIQNLAKLMLKTN